MVDHLPNNPTHLTSAQNQGQGQHIYGFYSAATNSFYQVPQGDSTLFESLANLLQQAQNQQMGSANGSQPNASPSNPTA